ncbi:ArdC-like ssDNA-binding domain-containing protein [Bradyrhizobium sp. ERR14]|uniref:ArdC-like ssDNA-binding domain-containing protein n=1 Tax=Bradyrhizobium sp. ERR14 TaxID=2663837 RepID=UPI0017E4E14C|nr:antirestriction protein ArdC [Bradyrhizobium sp. ERR14]
MKADICQSITDQIVRELEDGVRPWIKPWNAGNGSGRIARPQRALNPMSRLAKMKRGPFRS